MLYVDITLVLHWPVNFFPHSMSLRCIRRWMTRWPSCGWNWLLVILWLCALLGYPICLHLCLHFIVDAFLILSLIFILFFLFFPRISYPPALEKTKIFPRPAATPKTNLFFLPINDLIASIGDGDRPVEVSSFLACPISTFRRIEKSKTKPARRCERERESTSGRQSARRSWSRFPVNYSRIWFLISFASSRGLIRVEENNSDDYLHTPCRYSRCLSLICG